MVIGKYKMSQWTHVSGIIRIDSLQMDIKDEIREAFGNTFSYEDEAEKWDNCDVPFGSEGSIQYNIFEYPDRKDSFIYGHISIWGDLRNFSNVKDIYGWIVDSINKLKVGHVRDLSVSIDVESHNRHIIYLEGRNIKMDEIKKEDGAKK